MTRRTRVDAALSVSVDGSVWTFDGSRPVVVGRDPQCDVRLTADQVSRVHLSLRHEEQGWFLRDLGSRDGTRVDGSAAEATRTGTGVFLEPGRAHRVRLGGGEGAGVGGPPRPRAGGG